MFLEIWTWFSQTLGITTNWQYFQLSDQLRDSEASQGEIWLQTHGSAGSWGICLSSFGETSSVQIQGVNKQVSLCRASSSLIYWASRLSGPQVYMGQSPIWPPTLLGHCSFSLVSPCCSNPIRNPQHKNHFQRLFYFMQSCFLFLSRPSIVFLTWASAFYLSFICMQTFFSFI